MKKSHYLAIVAQTRGLALKNYSVVVIENRTIDGIRNCAAMGIIHVCSSGIASVD
jgi:hypothetical protein